MVAVQVKCIQDAIRDKKQRFNFLGEDINLIATVGIFITMNPGKPSRFKIIDFVAIYQVPIIITVDSLINTKHMLSPAWSCLSNPICFESGQLQY